MALGDCIVRHTERGGKPFAGGLPLATPFGTIYATNITPDVETSIGSCWKRSRGRCVMGSRRTDTCYIQRFPYIHFTRMSDRDISTVHTWDHFTPAMVTEVNASLDALR